jgi:hypothetical protein
MSLASTASVSIAVSKPDPGNTHIDEVLMIHHQVVDVDKWLRRCGQLLDRLNTEIELIAHRRCTGTLYMRDGKYAYANHGVGQPCPIHGEPEPGHRIRKYIGSDSVRIAGLRQAIDRQRRYQQLVAGRAALLRALEDLKAWTSHEPQNLRFACQTAAQPLSPA